MRPEMCRSTFVITWVRLKIEAGNCHSVNGGPVPPVISEYAHSYIHAYIRAYMNKKSLEIRRLEIETCNCKYPTG
jgi:hypothetical protein